MFLPNINLEIKDGMVALKDFKEDKLLKSKVPLWVRSRKLPIVENHELKTPIKQSDIKSRGAPLAFVSNFFLQRLEEDSSDVLGSITIGELAKEVKLKHYKDCYILPKPYPNLPRNTEGNIYIWVPPASHLKNDSADMQNSKIELISQTFTDYNNRLHEYFIILPKNFLSDKSIKRLRSLILGKTSQAIILKIKPYFNAVLLKISNNIDPRKDIPCKILTEPKKITDMKETDSYRLYFKKLAAEINGFQTNWNLTKDNQKAIILPIKKEVKIIGDFIDIIHLNRSEMKVDKYENSTYVKNSGICDSNISFLKKDRIFYAIDGINFNEPSFKVNDLDLGSVENIKLADIQFPHKKVMVCKNDLVIKARAPMTISVPPNDGLTALLPNHYYIIKLNSEYERDPNKDKLMISIHNAISVFNKKYKQEIDCLGTIGFELLRQIPLSE